MLPLEQVEDHVLGAEAGCVPALFETTPASDPPAVSHNQPSCAPITVRPPRFTPGQKRLEAICLRRRPSAAGSGRAPQTSRATSRQPLLARQGRVSVRCAISRTTRKASTFNRPIARARCIDSLPAGIAPVIPRRTRPDRRQPRTQPASSAPAGPTLAPHHQPGRASITRNRTCDRTTGRKP